MKSFSFFIIALLLLMPWKLGAQPDLDEKGFREYFNPYVGTWQGEYRIFSPRDELLNKFQVTRHYWWDGNVFMGRISYDFGSAQQAFYHRIVLSEGLPYSFVTTAVDATDVRSALRGEVGGGSLVWTRVLPQGSLPVRISERIIETGDGRFIEFWGDQEAMTQGGDPMLVRIEGFASFLPGSAEYSVATEKADTPSISEEQPEEQPFAVAAVDEPEPAIEHEPQPEAIEVLPPAPKPELASALQRLNIVGIDARPGKERIVVDFFLLYAIGDQLGTEIPSFFTGVDDQYLYFEDVDGFQYSVVRRDWREQQ